MLTGLYGYVGRLRHYVDGHCWRLEANAYSLPSGTCRYDRGVAGCMCITSHLIINIVLPAHEVRIDIWTRLDCDEWVNCPCSTNSGALA